jgi:membrane-bound inhibitor of C-type lysozyme
MINRHRLLAACLMAAPLCMGLARQAVPGGALTSPLQPIGKGSFTCEGAPTTTATFYKTEPGLAVLKRGTDTRIAFAVVAASGARYLGDDVSFWETRGEATINWSGVERRCSKLP